MLMLIMLGLIANLGFGFFEVEASFEPQNEVLNSYMIVVEGSEESTHLTPNELYEKGLTDSDSVLGYSPNALELINRSTCKGFFPSLQELSRGEKNTI